MLYRKDYKLELKSLSEDGEFQGVGSKTGNQDLHGDVIEAGAFKRTLANRAKSKKALPVLWQHDFREPIGRINAEDMVETGKGLEIKGKLTLSVERAREARDLIQDGAISGLSIGFEIPKNKAKFDDELNGRRISEVILWEMSIVTFPANPRATISGVKDFYPFDLTDQEKDACDACGYDVDALDGAIESLQALRATRGTVEGNSDSGVTDSASADGKELASEQWLREILETANKFRG